MDKQTTGCRSLAANGLGQGVGSRNPSKALKPRPHRDESRQQEASSGQPGTNMDLFENSHSIHLGAGSTVLKTQARVS